MMLEEYITDHVRCVKSIIEIRPLIEKVASIIGDAINADQKILVAGNGGSAADAQHFAAELVGRYVKNREALPAISLTVDSSIVTCIGNDFGFDEVFSRQIQAYGNSGDIFIAFSTSGKSPNILKALKQAHEKNLRCILLTGASDSSAADFAEVIIHVNSNKTSHIQEAHIVIYHLICEIIDELYE